MIIMGVTGCGKTSVGEALAEKLGAQYVDGDDLHSPESIKKMMSGIPLENKDRWPWLKQVGERLGQADVYCIIGCSALKRVYRDRIRQFAGDNVIFVYLAGTRDLIFSRINTRTGHFMPTTMLDSQFAALEPPTAEESAITVNIDQSVNSIVEDLMKELEESQKYGK